MTKYLLFILILLTACSDHDDGYDFDLPASARLQATLVHARQVLRSAPYGWELEYYPGKELKYGGIIYTVRFDSLTVTAACSLIPDSTATSYYKMSNDNGPVLTFDTYNPLLHYYATPSSSEYEAKGGDFEFVIDSIADDYISLYGKKTGNRMSMRKLTENADSYSQQTIDVFDHFVDSIRGNIGSTTIVAKCSPADKHIIMKAGGDTTVVLPYTYTNRGIRLYRPITAGGISVRSFDFDPSTLLFTCTDPGHESIQLTGIPYDETTMSYAKYEGDYNLVYQGANVPVHLKPNRLEGTYLMQGLSAKYDLVLRYNTESGDLTLGSQVAGESEGRTIYWVCYDYASGALSLEDEGQFTLKWNKNRFYPMYNFTATNPKMLDCTAGLLIYVYVDEQGVSRASVVDDGAWLTNGSPLFQGLKSLNRRSRLE